MKKYRLINDKETRFARYGYNFAEKLIRKGGNIFTLAIFITNLNFTLMTCTTKITKVTRCHNVFSRLFYKSNIVAFNIKPGKDKFRSNIIIIHLLYRMTYTSVSSIVMLF